MSLILKTALLASVIILARPDPDPEPPSDRLKDADIRGKVTMLRELKSRVTFGYIDVEGKTRDKKDETIRVALRTRSKLTKLAGGKVTAATWADFKAGCKVEVILEPLPPNLKPAPTRIRTAREVLIVAAK